MRMADTPEVAMTLAQLGMRLNRTGTMASAPWSNLFPNTNERWLKENTGNNMLGTNNWVLWQCTPTLCLVNFNYSQCFSLINKTMAAHHSLPQNKILFFFLTAFHNLSALSVSPPLLLNSVCLSRALTLTQTYTCTGHVGTNVTNKMCWMSNCKCPIPQDPATIVS